MEKPSVRKKVFLRDIVKLRPCAVCEADSTGIHFGVFSCEACKSFFRRTLNRHREMVCPRDGKCNIKYGEIKGSPCCACRIQRCLEVGMSRNAVKKGRYTLEKRAETIKDSREYWKFNTSPSQPNVTSTITSNAESENLFASKDMSMSHDGVIEHKDSSSGSDSTISSLLVTPLKTPLSVSGLLTRSSDLEKNLAFTADQQTTEAGSDSTKLISEIHNTSSAKDQENSIQMQIETPMDVMPETMNNRDDMPENDPLRTVPGMFPRANLNENMAHLPNDQPSHTNPFSIQNMKPNTRSGYAMARTAMPKHNILCNLPSRQAVSSFLSSCFSQDESVEQFFNSINSPVNDIDVALADDDDSTIDKVIDQTIEAFDKQNFMTRGYLAKIPEYQHKFMIEKRERERLFGQMKPLTFSEHNQFFDDTGIDLDGRLEKLERFAKYILVPHWKKVASYISSLPGVQTLPLEDQLSLLKYSKGEYKITAQFSAFNTAHKLYTIPEGNLDTTLDYDELQIFHSKETLDGAYKSARALQNLSLTDQEYAMLSAVAIIRPEACITQEGKEKCAVIRRWLYKALERLLNKRLAPLEAHRTLIAIRTLVERINSITERYTREWDQKFLAHRQIKWPKFIMDLVTSPIPPEEEDCASTAHPGETA